MWRYKSMAEPSARFRPYAVERELDRGRLRWKTRAIKRYMQARLTRAAAEKVDFRSAHFGRMTPVVEKDKAANPVEISLFGVEGVMLGAKAVANLIEQAGRLARGNCIFRQGRVGYSHRGSLLRHA